MNPTNATPQEVLAQALTVRDDGQEPKYEAHEYECVLLDVARAEQESYEDFPTALARSVKTSDHADALVFAADRARARESFGKSAPVAKWAADAEAEMLDLAARDARPGESVAMSYARLCSTDERMAKLYAETQIEDQPQRYGDDRFDRLLTEMASARKRDGETLEKAVARLLDTDPTVAAAFAAANGL